MFFVLMELAVKEKEREKKVEGKIFLFVLQQIFFFSAMRRKNHKKKITKRKEYRWCSGAYVSKEIGYTG